MGDPIREAQPSPVQNAQAVHCGSSRAKDTATGIARSTAATKKELSNGTSLCGGQWRWPWPAVAARSRSACRAGPEEAAWKVYVLYTVMQARCDQDSDSGGSPPVPCLVPPGRVFQSVSGLSRRQGSSDDPVEDWRKKSNKRIDEKQKSR